MSKIIIDEIEAKTTNVALTPNGTGNVEITGELVDATLQLNTSTQLNNIKIKTPPNSAGQSHTLILPDNNVEVDKYLKVKSVTGSGSTASGQLEYATIATTDTTNLNADEFTTGTIPSARLPSSFPNTSGFAYKLIQKTTLTSNVTEIAFTGLDVDSQYVLIGKTVILTSTGWNELAFLDSSGYALGNGKREVHERLAKYNETYYHHSGGFNGTNSNYFRMSGYQSEQNPFILEFNTDSYNPAMHYKQWHDHYNQSSYSGACEAYMSLTTTNVSPRGISLKNNNSPYGTYFESPTELMLYKYIES